MTAHQGKDGVYQAQRSRIPPGCGPGGGSGAQLLEDERNAALAGTQQTRGLPAGSPYRIALPVAPRLACPEFAIDIWSRSMVLLALVGFVCIPRPANPSLASQHEHRRATRGRNDAACCASDDLCHQRAAWYDRGEGRRRWRALDLGTIPVWLEADAPRVNCPLHGPTVRAAPWARHAAGHTYAFDEQVAWLATQCSKSAVPELMRIAWRTVGAIITRVWDDVEKLHDRFAGLKRIGIDEIIRRGHRYLTVVVDHDSGRLVWAAPGRDKATLALFFDALGEQRCAQITHVSADGADWITGVVADRCPNAVRCADPFYAEVLVMPVSWRCAWSAAVTVGARSA
jgi:hypothetical protein